MSFPYTFESNFEAGSNAEWDSETDTQSKLDFPHYTQLARYPWSGFSPYRGAYCARVQTGGITDAYLTEADCDISVGGTAWFKFAVYFADDFTGTGNDTFEFLKLMQDGGTVEASVGARIVASTGVINFGVGETAPTVFSGNSVERNKWYRLDVAVVCDSGGNDGSVNLYVNGASVAEATVSSLTQGAIGQARFGAQDVALTTSGTILLDTFAMDDARLPNDDSTNPMSLVVTKSTHVFAGPGNLAEVDLISSSSTDNVVTVYDTDEADTTARVILRLNNTVASEFVPSGPLEDRRLVRGCYVELSGTNPRALVNVCKAPTLISKSVLREYARGSK